jgi:phosphate transport system permease protein
MADLLFLNLCRGAALLIVLVALLLVVVLVWHSWLAMTTIGPKFLVTKTWDPVDDVDHRQFGSLAFVFGTVTTSAIAMLIAVPLGVGTAAYLAEIASGWMRRTATFLVEMLAAIPSVVYGFWGMFFLAPYLQRIYTMFGGPNEGGLGILAGGLILSIMIVPYIAAVSYDVCRAVPRSQREGALALGATRWQTIWKVVLPYARPGIVGAAFLALGRALGETMAITMLIGNRPEIRWSPFPITIMMEGQPEKFTPFALGDSIASVISNQFTEANYALFRSVLVELGLLLLLVTVIINSVARLLIWRVGRGGSFWRGHHHSAASTTGSTAPTVNGVAADTQARHAPIVGSPAALRIDVVMTQVLRLCLATTLGPLFLILGYLIYRGVGALNWDFFVNLPVGPMRAGGGVANALLGSTKIVGLATLFAVPVGLLAAIFLAEYRGGPLAAVVRFIGELLGGVPSIVIGIFAATVIAEPFRAFGWGGVFALSVMMVPIVMRASEESLKLVPQTLRNASYALGASQWQTVLRVTVPAALPAIITGVFLAIARIAGESAPLLLTAGENSLWPQSLSDYTPTLPVTIFRYATSPFGDLNRQAWAAAFVLLTVVMLLNFGIRFLTGRRVVMATRAD